MTGRKRFYLVPPTTANLKAYMKWVRRPDQVNQ